MEVLPNLPHPNSCQQFVKCSVQNQALHKSAMCYIRVLDRNKGGGEGCRNDTSVEEKHKTSCFVH